MSPTIPAGAPVVIRPAAADAGEPWQIVGHVAADAVFDAAPQDETFTDWGGDTVRTTAVSTSFVLTVQQHQADMVNLLWGGPVRARPLTRRARMWRAITRTGARVMVRAAWLLAWVRGTPRT